MSENWSSCTVKVIWSSCEHSWHWPSLNWRGNCLRGVKLLIAKINTCFQFFFFWHIKYFYIVVLFPLFLFFYQNTTICRYITETNHSEAIRADLNISIMLSFRKGPILTKFVVTPKYKRHKIQYQNCRTSALVQTKPETKTNELVPKSVLKNTYKKQWISSQ